MRTKVCFKCGIEQPILSFYKHPQMGDGYLGKCKSCTRYDVRKNYKDKRDYYVAYDKARYQADPKKRTPKPRTGLKGAAGRAVKAALASGRLVKMPCEVCGNVKSEAHHPDYSKPLDVMWVCREHHRVIHRMDSEV